MIARYPVSNRNVLVTCREPLGLELGAERLGAERPLGRTIGICNFDIVCHLIIGIWDFSALSSKANRFYLNQLELTLTDPCLW